MADYRLRLYRKFPEKLVRQVVIYLNPSQSPLVRETTFNIGSLNHQFEIIRLWEQPTAIFQKYQGLGSVSDLLEGMMGLDRKFVSIDK
jgi:predicted transposase YdaD